MLTGNVARNNRVRKGAGGGLGSIATGGAVDRNRGNKSETPVSAASHTKTDGDATVRQRWVKETDTVLGTGVIEEDEVADHMEKGDVGNPGGTTGGNDNTDHLVNRDVEKDDGVCVDTNTITDVTYDVQIEKGQAKRTHDNAEADLDAAQTEIEAEVAVDTNRCAEIV